MSITSEIQRLRTNINNMRQNTDSILEAIANKGVTVPSGSKLDDVPGLIGDISGSTVKLNIFRYELNKDRWFDTPHFNLIDCDDIEENWEFAIHQYPSDGFSICNGQWYSGSVSFWRGIAIYISQSKIDFAVNTTEHFIDQNYTTGDKVVLNIKTDQNNAVAKVYYNDVLVQEYTASRSDLNLTNDMYFRVGGLRCVASDQPSFSGTMNLNNCYIKLNGVLAWGVSNFRKSEAVIGGKAYRTVRMPDGKEWLAENLDYKFCNIGGGGTPSTPNAWYYNNDEATYGIDGVRKCGLLYNWYAAKFLNDNRSELIPGWHVPTNDEWTALANAVGGTSTAGTKLKAANVSWATSWGGTDDYGFEVLPTGLYTGSFNDVGSYAYFWSVTESGSFAYLRFFDTGAAMGQSTGYTNYGRSVRLVKDF